MNSLYRHDFKGVVWAGYRGKLPFWAKPLKDCGKYKEFEVAKDCVIRFVYLDDTEKHLCFYKPIFMLEVFDNLSPDAEGLFYFDADITLRVRWNFFEEWIKYGIVVCQDAEGFGYLLKNHPYRMVWKKHIESLGYKINRELDEYFNAGFVGMKREHKSALEVWKRLMEGIGEIDSCLSNIGDKIKLIQKHSFSPFFILDQDAFNMMVMATEHPISSIGQEGMGFTTGRTHCMFHPLEKLKPWRKRRYSSEKIDFGLMQRNSYWWHSQEPIRLYPSRKKLILEKLSSFLKFSGLRERSRIKKI